MSPATFPGKWARKCAANFHIVLAFIVFLWFDFVETLLCVAFKCLDKFFEGKASACHCGRKREAGGYGAGNEENELVSETLFSRKNIFREMGFLGKSTGDDYKKMDYDVGEMKKRNRWSDCGCEYCVSWMKCDHDELKLHVEVMEPVEVNEECSRGKPIENVMFLHGLVSSSSFWTETVFPNLSDHQKKNYRLFAIDLLGFGRSPKPSNSMYAVKDHLEMIEKSVIDANELKSVHLVAQSMGCIVALALAAKHPELMRSVTFVAPPFFPTSKDGASLAPHRRVAEKRLWPPLTFFKAVMAWYEHLGRCFCLFVCRHHRTLENLLKLLTRRRSLHFLIVDFSKHTHRSAWHTIHNVICGSARYIDTHLETLAKSGVQVYVIHGDQDKTVPLECSYYIKAKIPDAEVNIVANFDHKSVILRRDKEFTQSLVHIWESSRSFSRTTEDSSDNI